MKRSEIQRKAELQRKTPLRATGGPVRVSALNTSAGIRRTGPKPRESQLKRSEPKRQKSRAESDPTWTPARLAALDRDGGRCAKCGHRATEVHHRVLLQMGGSSDPDRHRLDRLVSLCERDHDWAHDERTEAKDLGYIVPRPTDAWTVPVMTIDGLRWFTPSGVISFTAA